MAQYVVRFDQATIHPLEIEAHYVKIEEGFANFRDKAHQTLAAINVGYVVSIVRRGAEGAVLPG